MSSKSIFLGFGLLLILAGAVGALVFLEAFQLCTSSYGEAARIFDSNINEMCSRNINRFYASVLGLVFGVVLTIVSLSLKDEKEAPVKIDVSGGSSKPALETARMRFASGEITAEEFDEIRRKLQE